MEKPIDHQREAGVAEGSLVLSGPDGIAVLDIKVTDTDLQKVMRRVVRLAQVAYLDGQSVVTDQRAGMEPDQPAPPHPRPMMTPAPSTTDRVGVLTFGHQPPSGGGSSGSVGLSADTEALTESCMTLRTHGPHLWRKSEPGRVFGPLVQCPGMEVGPATAFGAGRPAPPPAQEPEVSSDGGAGGTLCLAQCDNQEPHRSHTWRDREVLVGSDGGYGEKARCPGVEPSKE